MAGALFATEGISAQLTRVPVPAHSPVTLQFRVLDPAGTRIDEQWVLETMTSALQAQSRQPLKSTGTGTTELSGLRTHLDKNQSQIVFEYVHVDRNKMGDEWGQDLTLPVLYEVTPHNDAITIRLLSPQLADLTTRSTPGMFFLPTPKLEHLEELLDDFSAIMTQAASLKLHHTFLFQGELSASISRESSIGNFDRLLGRYGYGKHEERPFDLMHDDVFSYRTAQTVVAVKIAAFSAPHGSEIFFEAWLPFELGADGTATGYDLPLLLTSDIGRILKDRPPQ